MDLHLRFDEEPGAFLDSMLNLIRHVLGFLCHRSHLAAEPASTHVCSAGEFVCVVGRLYCPLQRAELNRSLGPEIRAIFRQVSRQLHLREGSHIVRNDAHRAYMRYQTVPHMADAVT